MAVTLARCDGSLLRVGPNLVATDGSRLCLGFPSHVHMVVYLTDCPYCDNISTTFQLDGTDATVGTLCRWDYSYTNYDDADCPVLLTCSIWKWLDSGVLNWRILATVRIGFIEVGSSFQASGDWTDVMPLPASKSLTVDEYDCMSGSVTLNGLTA